ncbi:ABC transporter A family protein [Heterostelium album PN500]|uniref:ABC transporter A family protein n=1 Tax=Heterostelium pallidum (strain ATCC 26659 / Pp 5 / PN500) TaxID=670386 RepID=D3BDQ4_HETP5|nr:ABC transporter A family protein [Heterostelium album PN500]EFA80035.1 ABC transporter A family protein [Heterostelium album PN500]|eukprot:XP_020432155.1 ABC transporter A family protein [Heterostelium album PN500]
MVQKASLFQQFYVLLYKQYLLLARNKALTFFRLTTPFWATLIYFIVFKSLSGKVDKPNFNPIESIVSDYQVGADYDLQYNFGNISDANKQIILNSIQTTMGWQSSRMMELSGDIDQLDYFDGQLTSQVNSNMSFASVFFDQVNDTNIYYNLAYNQNDGLVKSSLIIQYQWGMSDQLRYAKAIRYAIEKGIIDVFSQGQAKVTTYNQEAPNFLADNGLPPSTTILAMFYPTFIVFGITFPFILFVYLIVEEKERKIRSYLRAFGVIDTIYFSTWIIDGMLVALFNTIVIMIFGYAAKIQFISNCASSVIFVVLMTYQLSLVGIGVLLSSLLSRTRAAMIFAVIIYCVALAGSIVLSMMTDVLYGLWSDKAKYYNWLIAFQVISPLNFLKLMVDISTVTINANFNSFAGNQNIKGGEYEWSNFVNHINTTNGDRPVTTSYNTNSYIFIATLIYLFLAWVFDKVIPDDFGGRRVPWFFATKSFWWPDSVPEEIHEHDLHTHINSSDPDIQSESTNVNLDNFDNYSLVVRNLVKRYGSKKVVDNLSFSAEKGKIIAMLGHNGAGKTTTINMITGQTTITGGNIFVHGYNVNTQIDYVKTMLGLCPQFDVYWPDFTAREHLTIMTLVKEKRTNIKHDINEILQSVRLSSVADNIVSSYSGGMRRRLSVAIGIIGDPQVIVLDEPTTGIDPANRRYIWKLIKSIKKDKLILLTTHSMEEADALGDKIIIMDGGKLSGAGTSLHLKDRFGTGYKLHLVTTNIEEAQRLVQHHLPIAKLDRINSMNLVYTIPSMEQLSSFLKFLTVEKSIDKLITDWQIQNTTLEDVFLQMVRKPEDKK